MTTPWAPSWTGVALVLGLLLTSAARPAGGESASRDNTLEASQAPASTQSGQKTVWEGVFTEEQGARGLQHYRRSCGQCHSDDLSGGGDGEPALAGTIFMAQWQGRSVADLFAVVSETMPYSAPGSLRGQEYVDIVSYLLKANGVPAGPVELSFEREKLKQILVTEPAAEQPRP